ncbi:hypothetical protein N2152v2_007808 [Parachlorella kessleri]
MDDYLDDIDNLLDFEGGLYESEDAGDAGVAAKRTRSVQPTWGGAGAAAAAGAAGTAAVLDEDDELLQLAEEAAEPPAGHTVGLMSSSEEQECRRRLAAFGTEDSSQPDGFTASQRSNGGAAATYRTMPESERQIRALLAAAGPDSQSEELLSLGSQRSQHNRARSTAGAAGAVLGSDPGTHGPTSVGEVELLLDEAELAELLAEGDAQQAQQAKQAQQASHTTSVGPAAELQEVLPRRQLLPPARAVDAIPGDFLTVTSEAGERVYCSLQEPRAAARHGDVLAALRRCRGRLLSEGLDTLLAQVDQEEYQRALAESEHAAAAGQGGGSRPAEQPAQGSGALWVQKYSPKTFWDLLSDEQINREVVRWLKGWDPCVFGRPAPAAPQAAAPGGGGSGRFGAPSRAQDPLGRPEHKVILLAGPPGLGKTTLAHVVARHCGYRPVEINASDDRSGAALAARVLDAVEMRAVMGERRPNCVIVDEIDGATGGAEGRSAISALLKIVSAAPGKKAGQQHGSRSGGSPDAGGESDSDVEDEREGGHDNSDRPGGSGGGSDRRKGPRSSASPAKQAGSSSSSGARRQLRPLMRPIICICNDLYAPALRPLRDVAQVFHFRKPQAERLAQRLQVVCGWEGLDADRSALRGLVERTDCDIRACLNTLQVGLVLAWEMGRTDCGARACLNRLQFVAKRCVGGLIKSCDLSGVQVGQKDMTKGAFAVWQDLLQKKASVEHQGILAWLEMQRAGIGSRMESDAERGARLFGSLMDFGEHDLVLSGLHENVLSLRYFDVGLSRTTALLGHLADADRLMRASHRTADFSLYKYIPASLVAASSLVAGHERPTLQWPKAGADARRRGAASRALLQGWLLRVDPHVFAATGPRAMVQEVLPSLLHILAPALRPVSRQLHSPEEQQAVEVVVGALLAYGLRFAQEGEDDAEEAEDLAGLRELQLRGVRPARQQQDPPMRLRPYVHRLCHFPGIVSSGRRLPMAIRQLVSHEADLEAIRRAGAIRHGDSSPGSSPGNHLQQQQQQQQHLLGVSQLGSGSGAPRERNPNVAPAPAGRMITTLAERMKGAQQQPAAVKKKAVSAPRGTWLDQLKEQRLQRRPAGAAAGRHGSGGGGDGAVAGGDHDAAPGGRRGQLPVLYKFHEGYTNAVKRPLLMRDLL